MFVLMATVLMLEMGYTSGFSGVIRLDISRVTFVGVQVKFAHVNAVNCRPQVMQVLHGGNIASWVRHHEEDYLTSSSAGQSNIFEGAVRLSPKTRSN